MILKSLLVSNEISQAMGIIPVPHYGVFYESEHMKGASAFPECILVMIQYAINL